ncbi:MAG: deoxyribodipyrimidine photo-lyase [Puniceicoccaceae bacterium]
MDESIGIVWFRRDLRLRDNPALQAASEHCRYILPIYLHDPSSEGNWTAGAASKSWLHYSLQALQQTLRSQGCPLLIRAGHSREILSDLINETGATHLFWNRCYEPSAMARDACIRQKFKPQGIHSQSFNASLLAEPWEIANQQGKPFQVFTPFWKHHRQHIADSKPLPTPDLNGRALRSIPTGIPLEELQLLPHPRWDRGFWQRFTPGEQGAQEALDSFVHEETILRYSTDRNRPDLKQTSLLSPHLHFGEISVRQVAHRVSQLGHGTHESIHTFLSEIGWREFAYHLLYHFPHTTQHPLKDKFTDFPWREAPEQLDAWRRGQTGIPIVDAGMRELWQTGWMHNRVRMITGSYLVKNLLIPWQSGASWFWDTLVDADLASNTLGWQWVAGCGADAAPYFRIFNPVLQSERFDPKGIYLRKWIPELASASERLIHTPWRDPNLLRKSGYPEKQISLIESRNRALAAYETMQQSH